MMQQSFNLEQVNYNIQSVKDTKTTARAFHIYCLYLCKKQNRTVTVTVLHTHTTILWPFFRDHPGELVPEENFWTLRCKGRLTEVVEFIQLCGRTTK